MKLWARSGYEWADNLSGLWSPVLTNGTGLTLLDSSSNGSDDATLTGYTNPNTAWQQTKAGMSVNFTGATYAVPQKTRSIFPLGFSARTMALWFIHTSGNTQAMMGYGGNSGSGQRFDFWPQLTNSIGVEIVGYGLQVDYTRTSEPRFIVATLNGLTSTLTSACKLFLDGIEGTNYQTFGSAVAIDTRNTGMTFGTISGAPNNNNFNGRILEAWILPSELNPGQILSAYQAGPGGMFDFQPRRRRSYFASTGNRRRRVLLGAEC